MGPAALYAILLAQVGKRLRLWLAGVEKFLAHPIPCWRLGLDLVC